MTRQFLLDQEVSSESPYEKVVQLVKGLQVDELSNDDWMSLLYYCPYDLAQGVKHK